MSKLRVQRAAIRRSFTTVYNELTKAFENENEVEKSLTNMLWKRLEDRFQQLTKIDDEIMQELRGNNETSEQEIDEEFEIVQEYRDMWNDLNSLHGPSADNGSDNNTSMDSLADELSKRKLIEFSGSPKEWLTFWSQFKVIHEDDSFSAEEKFQHLIQSTVSGSIARRVVSSFPPTADNYAKAIDHLKSRFGKVTELVEMYVRDLLKLVLSNANGKQRLSLASLYDQLEMQLRALESLGATSDKYASILYPLVESSLPEELLVTWERIRRDLNASDDTDQLKELMKFLRSEVESKDQALMAKRRVDDSDDSSDGSVKKKIKSDSNRITTIDLLSKSSTEKCVFCGKFHESQFCNDATLLKLHQRYAKIRAAAKCFKCLIGNHLKRTCEATIKCLSCGGNHYEILCDKIVVKNDH